MSEYGDCKGCKHLVIYDDGFGCSEQHETYDVGICHRYEEDGEVDE